MEKPKLIITPKTKVGELLDNFPEMENVLMQLSPAFERLKNPVLRRTVGRVATLQQIAVVGGINVDIIVNRLRKELGQSAEIEANINSEYLSSAIPDWFNKSKIVLKFDATPVINSGGSPMADILSYTNKLKEGEIFELTSPFVPAPILDLLQKKGFRFLCAQMDDHVISYVIR
jgi:hypothetical protein